jgi:hypothetical protein
MMRFYGMTDRDVFCMPFSRLLLLYQQIDKLEAEEEMRQLVTYHTGDPKERLEVLQGYAHGRFVKPAKTTEQLMQAPSARHVMSLVDGDDIRNEIKRMQAADAERRAEWEARNAVQPSSVLPASTPEV